MFAIFPLEIRIHPLQYPPLVLAELRVKEDHDEDSPCQAFFLSLN
jgi:hypothetical protein